MNKLTYLAVLCVGGAVLFSSCKKVEGPGGTSSITGNLSGVISGNSDSEPEQEITTVICTHADGIGGSILDNSDYFLLQTPNGGTSYYVWYENTNWLGQDPGLSGRTGIKVTYSNTESNVTIAANTAAAITASASSDFIVSVTNDIVTLTNTLVGEVTDADDVNTPFAIDVSNQGKGGSSGGSSTSGPMADERVYLIYGEEASYSESVRTDASGNYQFKGLTRGTYTVYAFSIDVLSPTLETIQVEVEATITEKKQVATAPALTIVQ